MNPYSYRRTRRIFLVLPILFISIGCTRASEKVEVIQRGDYRYTEQYISRLIKKEMKKYKVKGLSIALLDDQSVVWADGFGYSDVANRVPAAAETIYPVGSISKLFTATAAMQLAEQGKLDIDKPLQIYLPEFSLKARFPGAQHVTPRTLLTHHSGSPHSWYKGCWSRAPVPFTEVVHEIKGEYLVYPPHFVFSYSDVGMTLLGHTIEKVSGVDFVTHMKASLLRPLGMRHASFSLRDDMRGLVSKGYRDGREEEELLWRDTPSGGLYASVLDLTQFMKMVFADGRVGDHQIVRPETLSEMLRPQNSGVALDLDFRIGLGWMLSWNPFLGQGELKPEIAVAQHAGATQHFRGRLITLPGYKLGVAVLANASNADPVVDEVSTQTLNLALMTKAGIPLSESSRAAPTVSLSPKEFEKYKGIYATPIGLIRVMKKWGRPCIDLMGETLCIRYHPDRSLSLRYLLLGLIPIKIEMLEGYRFSRETVEGRELLVSRDAFGRKMLFGVRIHPSPVSEAWRNRVGEYTVLNPDEPNLIDRVRLSCEKGLLFLNVVTSSTENPSGETEWALSPISDTEGVIVSLGGFLPTIDGTVHVRTKGEKEQLFYSGYEFRRLDD